MPQVYRTSSCSNLYTPCTPPAMLQERCASNLREFRFATFRSLLILGLTARTPRCLGIRGVEAAGDECAACRLLARLSPRLQGAHECEVVVYAQTHSQRLSPRLQGAHECERERTNELARIRECVGGNWTERKHARVRDSSWLRK